MKLFRDFISEIIRETPINILKACGTISYDIQPFGPLDLFYACFVSIWNELEEDKLKSQIVYFLELALTNSNLPEIIKVILDLDEFLERCNVNSFPLSIRLLSEKSLNIRDYSRALRYLEEQFRVAIFHLKKNYISSGIFTSTVESFNQNQNFRLKGSNLDNMTSHQQQIYLIELIEQLVSLNYQLQKHEAAIGILDFVSKYLDHLEAKNKVKWFEKLHEWKKALCIYEENFFSIHPTLMKLSPNNPNRYLIENSNELSSSKLDILVGRLRCFRGLGEWEKLNDSSKNLLNVLNKPFVQSCDFKQDINLNQKIAEMGAMACWGLNEWSQMEKYLEYLPETTYEGCLYRSVFEITKNNGNDNINENAIKFIEKARDLLDPELTSSAFQSYERSYQAVIEAQILVELEEMITYKQEPFKRSFLIQKWWKRLNGCERSAEYWHRLIICAPKEKGFKYRLKCSSFCRKLGYVNLSNQILSSVLDEVIELNKEKNLSSTSRDFELCQYAYLKYLFKSGKFDEALNSLNIFVESNLQPKLKKCQEIYLKYSVSNSPSRINLEELFKRILDISNRLSKCYLKLGQINQELNECNDISSMNTVINYFELAKQHNQESYKAWQAWAYANYTLCKKNNPVKSGDPKVLTDCYVKSSILGFFKSLQLSFSHDKSNLLQDTLRLLAIWFNFCDSEDIYELICSNIKTVSDQVWISVIPQVNKNSIFKKLKSFKCY